MCLVENKNNKTLLEDLMSLWRKREKKKSIDEESVVMMTPRNTQKKNEKKLLNVSEDVI